MRRDRALKVVLVLVGLLFMAGIIPLTSVYPDDERVDGHDLSGSTIDQRVASYGNPEDEHLQSERLAG